jgi:hypothetical protein
MTTKAKSGEKILQNFEKTLSHKLDKKIPFLEHKREAKTCRLNINKFWLSLLFKFWTLTRNNSSPFFFIFGDKI